MKDIESKKEKTVQDAVNRVGISRSAFYKYRDSLLPFQNMSRNQSSSKPAASR